MGSLSGALGTLFGTIGIAPPLIGIIISIAVQRTYMHRLVGSIAAIGSTYILLSIGLNEPINGYQIAGTLLVASLTSFYNGRLSQKAKKKLLAKKIADTPQPTIQSAIQENTEVSKDTLSSDPYYGYIVGFITQILREEGYAEVSFDFKIIFYTMKNLSNRHVAEAHRFAVEAFLNDNYHNLGRNVKAFEYGFKAGEHEGASKCLDNLRNIILGKKLHYKIQSEKG